MFWPLARILFTTKEGSGCLTQLGREREREGEKEGKREHLCETLPFTSSLGIRGGKSRERRYIYARWESRIFETIFLQKLFPFVKTCETYPFETSQESFLSFIVEAFELCLFAFMHSSYRIPMLKVNLSCFYCDGFRFWIFGGFLSSLKINFLLKIVGYLFLVLIEFDEFYSKSWQQWWKVYSNFIRGKENNFLFQFQTIRNWFWNTFFPFFDWNLT